MRIEELWLDAYGPFTGVRFPLASDRLNVIFGPNEAGKSTSLRAIEALLFEHEEKSRDAHVHEMSKLRVGGRVSTKSGLELSFLRKKGRLRTVLDPSGEPIDDAPLAAMLGGISREVFRAVYGLDHIRLAEGGKALAQGKGLVGESLFAASMGIVHLHRLASALDEEADSIYKLRGTRPLNTALDACKKARDEADLGATSAETVANHRAELEKRIRDEAELKERKRAYEKERDRLRRIYVVRPSLMELRMVLEALAARGAPRVVDPKAREDAERVLAVSGHAVEKTEADLGTAKRERAAVPIDMKVLAYKDEIRGLWTERGAHIKALHDRAGLERELAELRRSLDGLLGAPEIDSSAIDAAIKRAKGADAREERLAAEDAEIEELIVSTGADLEALDLDSDLAAALRLPVPSEETIDEAERTFDPHRTREDDLERAVVEREREIRELEDEIASVRATSETPTEKELAEARAKRDAVVDKGKLHEAVRAIAAADRVVDRMRADAEAASTLALRERELEAAKTAQIRDRRALDEAKKELARLQKGWEKIWAKTGVEVGTPVEMRAWHRRFSEARDACADVEKRRRDATTERAALEKVHADLERAGKPFRIASESIGELLERLREHHRTLEKAELGRKKESENAKEKVERLERRLADMDREAQTFAARVAALVRNADPKLDAGDPVGSLATIYEHWVSAEQDRKVADSADARVKELEAHLAEMRAKIAEATAVLDRLLAVSGAESIAELRVFEQASREIEHLRATKEKLESDLARLGDGRSIEDLETEASEVTSIEEARAKTEELDRMLEQTNEALENATREVHSLEAGMKDYEQPLAFAAEAASRAEGHLARARELALRHARLKLAGGVLARAIERLRDQSQGPVIVRASAIFHRLTLGGFQKLAVALDDKDQPVLVGIRPDGREAGVLGMSDGTRDQLYLALRVASLERLAENGDPLPLVLDDVLMSFDDDRARAALGILAELARKMQVLLFTHHARTVELAREAVLDLALHELPSKAAVSAA